MRIAVDIDGTICVQNVKRYMQVCNEKLKLGIEYERLATLTYTNFLQQPEVLAYKQKWGEEYARLTMGWIDLDPEVLVDVLPIPGAIDGVCKLAEVGAVTYYTARYTSQSIETSQAMANATRQWLRKHLFPSPEEIIFCESPQDKLIRIAERSATEDRAVILIDDRYPKLLEVVEILDSRLQEILRRYVTLVAFGATSELAECYGIEVIPFETWPSVDQLIERLAIRQGGSTDVTSSSTKGTFPTNGNRSAHSPTARATTGPMAST